MLLEVASLEACEAGNRPGHMVRRTRDYSAKDDAEMMKAKVHPQIEQVLQALAKANLAPFEALQPDQARAQMEAMVKARNIPLPPLAGIENRRIPGPLGEIPLRIYRPLEPRTSGAVLYYHGGGHVIGSLDTHAAVASALCAKSGTVFVSVDYRMGPEHKFPAAVDDSFAALNWVAANAAELGVDAGKLAVAGDSAGGNLAAVVALLARDAGQPPLRLQVLAYPVADYRLMDQSYNTYAQGYGPLSDKAMSWFRQHYLRNAADAEDWRASPVLASHESVAPAIVLTAECDVLHDEGVRLAQALSRAGVRVDHQDYAGIIHGFLGMAPAVDAAVEAQDRIARALIQALS
jgi:acetyl esterase